MKRGRRPGRRGSPARGHETPARRPHAEVGGFTLEQVREAARAALAEAAHPKSVVRVSERRVVTDGRFGDCGVHVACGEAPARHRRIGTPWATASVGLSDVDGATAVEIDVDYETRGHCEEGVRRPVTCPPATLASSGALEREILEGIAARLEGRSADRARGIQSLPEPNS